MLGIFVGEKTYDYCKNNVKNVIPIGAPFLYLDQLTKSYEKNQTARFVFQRIAIRQIKDFFSTNYLLILLWTTFHHLIRHAYFFRF